jgi:hypothetical protein
MRHFTSTQDWTVGELQALLDQAAGLRSDPVRPLLQGRTLAHRVWAERLALLRQNRGLLRGLFAQPLFTYAANSRFSFALRTHVARVCLWTVVL